VYKWTNAARHNQ